MAKPCHTCCATFTPGGHRVIVPAVHSWVCSVLLLLYMCLWGRVVLVIGARCGIVRLPGGQGNPFFLDSFETRHCLPLLQQRLCTRRSVMIECSSLLPVLNHGTLRARQDGHLPGVSTSQHPAQSVTLCSCSNIDSVTSTTPPHQASVQHAPHGWVTPLNNQWTAT